MKISIITIVRNDLEGLKKTVQSVLGQNYKDFEYVILDGASTDGCAEYINSLDVNIVKKSEPDKGIYNAMNKAVKMASGDYCLFLNAGDSFFDSFVLEKASAILGKSDLYVGNTMEFGDKVLKGWAPDPLTIQFLLKTSIYHQSTFIRRQLLLDYPYNENHKIVSDWEFFFERWLQGSTYEKLDFFVSNYYLGGFSYTHQDLISIERKEVINRLLPQRVIDELTQKENKTEDVKPQSLLEQKIAIAFTLPPIQRDLKILRNAFKALLRDCF